MTALEAALAAPEINRGASSGAWFVTGPAGSGKSWVLEQIVEAADGRQVRLLHGAGATVGDLTSLAESLDPPLSKMVTANDLARALTGAVVLVDDISGLADDAVELVRGVACQADSLNLLLVVTQREGTARRSTARLAAACGAVTLGPLDELRPTFRALVGNADNDVAGVVRLDSGGWHELVAAHPSIASAEVAAELIDPRMASVGDAASWLVTMLAFGGSLNDGSAETLSGASGPELDGLIDELHAGGLMHGGALTPLVARCVRSATPTGRRRQVLDTFVKSGSQQARSDLADWLMTTDDRSPEAAALLVVAGRDRPPTEAIVLLQAAVAAGAPAPAAELLVYAHLRAGNGTEALSQAVAAGLGGATVRAALARAGRMVDAHAAGGPDDLQQAVVAANIGEIDTAAKLLDGLDSGAIGADAAAAALVAATIELVDGGDAQRTTRDSARLARDGVDTSTWALDPHLCAAIATALALEKDEPATTASPGAFDQLAAVVGSWLAMRAGRLGDAQLDDPGNLLGLEAALASVVEAGIALRSDQLDALTSHVTRAVRGLEDIQLDSWHFPMVLEVLAPAARAGVDVERIGQACRDVVAHCGATSILRLSHAVAELLAAISADDDDLVKATVGAFGEIEGDTTAHRVFGEVVPVVAAVFGGDVRADDVLAAAATLREAGLVFEASRLTGAAALRSSDQREAKTLLRESRAMRQERRSGSSLASGDVTGLSDREVEVARLVVQGRTHKEVGATLFISAKTVEHHVARIRNKLGATGRAEMMSAIRNYLDTIVDIDA